MAKRKGSINFDVWIACFRCLELSWWLLVFGYCVYYREVTIKIFVMETQNPPERTAPVQYARSRAFRQFKNPPQPHMCIQDSIKDTSEKLYINVLGWQKIANPKQYSDPIPLYGGMQVSQCSNYLLYRWNLSKV